MGRIKIYTIRNKIYRCLGFLNLRNKGQFSYKYLLLDVTLNDSTLTYRYFYLRGYVYNPSGSWGYVTRARAPQQREERTAVGVSGGNPASWLLAAPRPGEDDEIPSLSLTHKRFPTDAAAWGTPPDILKQDLYSRNWYSTVLAHFSLTCYKHRVTSPESRINYWRTYLPHSIQIEKNVYFT